MKKHLKKISNRKIGSIDKEIKKEDWSAAEKMAEEILKEYGLKIID